MSDLLKKQSLKSAERLAEVAFEEVLNIAEAYAESTESEIDNSIVDAVRLLKSAFLDDLVNKIDGEEG